MAGDKTNRDNASIKVDSQYGGMADKANIASLKAAIQVQARLVAELRSELERLKAQRNNGTRVKSPTR